MFSISNIMGHPQSSIAGLLTGALQAAIMGAATVYTQTGNTSSWQPYAAAAASAAIPVILGGLYAPAPVADTPIQPETAATTDDPKAALMAKVDAALSLAAQQAMEAEAAKITGQLVQQPEVPLTAAQPVT